MFEKLPTVLVYHPELGSDPVTINEVDFNPQFHKPADTKSQKLYDTYQAGIAKPPVQPGAPAPIPASPAPAADPSIAPAQQNGGQVTPPAGQGQQGQQEAATLKTAGSPPAGTPPA